MLKAVGIHLLMLVGLLLSESFAGGQGLLLIEDPPTDPKRLQGTWEGDGPGGACTVVISGKTLRYSQPTRNGEEGEFWFETTMAIQADTSPQQFYATIVKDSSGEGTHVGTVVVVLYRILDGTLELGVIDHFEESAPSPVSREWERVIDLYTLRRKR